MITVNGETFMFKCENPNCYNDFKGHQVVHKGGINDYGWWIVKCEKCGFIFQIYVGRDVNDSSLVSGGEILRKFDKEIDTEKDVLLAVKEINKITKNK